MTDRGDDLQTQIDDIVARVTADRGDIDGLSQRADAAELRADEADRRADAMEARAQLDREMIAGLQADGVLSAAHVAELERALVTSRTIGAAIGLLMASRGIGQDDALTVLKHASQRTNTKLRDLAARVVADAEARH